MSGLEDFIGNLIKAAAKWVDKCLPEYQPSAWNDGNGIQLKNNCYNYGCDIQTGTFAQPGRAHGKQATQMACNKVVIAAAADGLVHVSTEDGCGCSECHHVVALVVWPDHDYHWYRRDKDGKWSHKMAHTPATNLDNSNNIITDPKIADRGTYTHFCGYFCVNKSKVTIS
jgi:hypothetical protein